MTYMIIMELFGEYPTPFSTEMAIVIDHDTNIYIEWHNIIIETERSTNATGSSILTQRFYVT